MNEADTVLDKVIAEAHALTRALAVIEARAPIEDARRACALYLERHDIDSVEALAIDCSLRRICGLSPPAYTATQFLEVPSNLEEVLLQEGVLRWLTWAGSALPIVGTHTIEPHSASVLNRMALTPWIEAVDQLRRGHEDDARRLFRRAVTFGGHYGTPSNPVIQWTYAASFFPAS
jgi:hypothetical protein